MVSKEVFGERCMNYNKLKQQSKIILKDRKINVFILIMLLLGFFVILYATLKTKEIYGFFILVMLFLLILFLMKCIKSNNLLLKQILSIEKNNAFFQTYQAELYYPKVIIQKIPEVAAYVSLSPTYYAIKIVDGKNVYFYFLEEPLRHDNKSIDNILKKFDGTIHIECYENTSIVKTIEGDPSFIHIRYGLLCE